MICTRRFGAQGLPILEKLYPRHWIFKEHPSLDAIEDPWSDESVHRTWADWSQLQWDTFCHVSEHVKQSESCGLHAQRTPDFAPPPVLLQLALRIGATWTQWDRIPAAKRNPGAALASKHIESLMPARQVRFLLGVIL
jgi:hypothetical protein